MLNSLNSDLTVNPNKFAPSAPQSFSLGTGNRIINEQQVTWAVPAHLGDFTPKIDGYVVKIYVHGEANPFKTDSVDANTFEYTKTDLNVGQQYDFRVAATYDGNKQSAYAGPISMTAGLLPDAPTLAQG